MFGSKKIAELEREITSLTLSNEAFKLRNNQIEIAEAELKKAKFKIEIAEAELKKAKFKIEVMQMLIDDDAILELLNAKNEKAEVEKTYNFDEWASAGAQASSNQQQSMGLARFGGVGSALGIFV